MYSSSNILLPTASVTLVTTTLVVKWQGYQGCSRRRPPPGSPRARWRIPCKTFRSWVFGARPLRAGELLFFRPGFYKFGSGVWFHVFEPQLQSAHNTAATCSDCRKNTEVSGRNYFLLTVALSHELLRFWSRNRHSCKSRGRKTFCSVSHFYDWLTFGLLWPCVWQNASMGVFETSDFGLEKI